ncbi:MAG: hypothetical protein ACK501_21480 [Planctomycetota bacterium]|jgi:hypothetical protein
MTADSDDAWAPLPADAQCAHPGELATLGKRELPAAAAPPAPAPAPSVAPPVAPAATKAVAAAESEDPAVLQALAALRAKIAAAPAPTSMVAEVEARHHREQRRQQRRRQQPPAGLQAAVVHATRSATAPAGEPAPAASANAMDVVGVRAPETPCATPAAATPQAEADTLLVASAVDDHDAREDEPWFHELPDVEQQRLRRAWAEKRAAAERAAGNVARNGNQRLVAGILVFVAVVLLGTGANGHATLGAGVVCGIWWRHARADRFLDPLRAFGCMAVLQTLAMLVNGSTSPTLFLDAPLLVAFAALVGFDGEMRRTGGFDVR